MTSHRVSAAGDRWLACDALGCGSTFVQPSRRSTSTSRLRTYASSEGWTSIITPQRARDYCPVHADLPSRAD